MPFAYVFIIKLFITGIFAIIITPIVKLITFRLGAVDMPNERRINKKPMPTSGGLSIFLTFVFSAVFLFKDVIPQKEYLYPILLAALIVVITGLIDDIRPLKPMAKMAGLIVAALVIYFVADIRMDTVSIILFGKINLGWLSLPLTVLWIVSITNAINLIDGLDGLAAGISIIALTTIGITGLFFLHVSTMYIPILIFVLVAAICGFFPYNYYPAKIFLGDTGALFLGFMIAVLSLQGLKNATIITLATPVFILGVPITDTLSAIIRRLMNKQPISSPDKMHLHHRLLSLGFSHKGAVLTIYCLALVFSFIALVLNYTSFWGSIMLLIAVAIGIELFVELIELVGPNRQPLMYLFKMIGNKQFRDEQLKKFKVKK